MIIWDNFRLWFTYGSLMVHLGELVRSGKVKQFTLVSQSGLIIIKVLFIKEFTILPSLGNGLIFGTVWKWTNFSLIIYPLRQYQQNNHVKLSHKDTITLTGKNLFNLNGKNTRTTTMGIALVSLWLTLIKYLPTRTVW